MLPFFFNNKHAFRDLLIGLDTSDKNLDGLIPDITSDNVNGIKLSNPQKIKLKRAIQKLQESRGYENGNNQNLNPNGKNDNLIKYVRNDEVKAIEILANHIDSSNKILDSLIDQCDKIEKCSTATQKEINDTFLNLTNALNKRKNDLLTESNQYYQMEISKIQEKIEIMKDSIGECEKTKGECSKLLTQGIKIDKLSQRAKSISDKIDKCVNKYTEENKTCAHVIGKTQTISNFSPKNEESMIESLSTFGFVCQKYNYDGLIWSTSDNLKHSSLIVQGDQNQIVSSVQTKNIWSSIFSHNWIDPKEVKVVYCKFKITNIDDKLKNNLNTWQIVVGVAADDTNTILNQGTTVGTYQSQWGYIGMEQKTRHGM